MSLDQHDLFVLTETLEARHSFGKLDNSRRVGTHEYAQATPHLQPLHVVDKFARLMMMTTRRHVVDDYTVGHIQVELFLVGNYLGQELLTVELGVRAKVLMRLCYREYFVTNGELFNGRVDDFICRCRHCIFVQISAQYLLLLIMMFDFSLLLLKLMSLL